MIILEVKMKLICKCGNIEDLKTDEKVQCFEIKDCGDGSVVLICKKCDNAVFLKFKN